MAEILSLLPKRILCSDSSKNSVYEIIRRLGYRTWIEKRDKKLSKTTKLINQHVETLEDFMIRKIKYAGEQFVKENRIPSSSGLIRRAVAYNRTTLNSKRNQEYITDYLHKIRKEVNK